MLRWSGVPPGQSPLSRRHARKRSATKPVLVVGQTRTRVAASSALPMARHATCARSLDTLPRCVVGGNRDSPSPKQPMQASKERGSPRFHMSNIRHNAITDPAPTISIHILSLNGSTDMEILPDSGANISAAGKETLSHLGKHVNNLLPSRIVPQAANRTSM